MFPLTALLFQPIALAMETMFNYTAFFHDNDTRYGRS